MKSVYKFSLVIEDEQEVEVPVGSKPLFIALQGAKACLWAEVDPDVTSKELIKIRCAGTGHYISDEYNVYLGSVMLYGGSFVFHFYTNSSRFRLASSLTSLESVEETD